MDLSAREQKGLLLAFQSAQSIRRKTDDLWVVPSQSGHGSYQVVQPPQVGKGERRLPLRDMVFVCAMKVYGGKATRRSMSDFAPRAEAREKLGHAAALGLLGGVVDGPVLAPRLPVRAGAGVVLWIDQRLQDRRQRRVLEVIDLKKRGFLTRLPHRNSVWAQAGARAGS